MGKGAPPPNDGTKVAPLGPVYQAGHAGGEPGLARCVCWFFYYMYVAALSTASQSHQGFTRDEG